jgi:hypothetical protein
VADALQDVPHDDPDVKVTLAGRPTGDAATPKPRAWLSVMFACCSVYQRVYKTAAGDCYAGGCPKCGRRVRFQVGSGGTSCRSFVAS